LAIIISVYAVGRAFTSQPVIGPDSLGIALAETVTYCFCVFLIVRWSLRANLEHWPGEVLPPKIPEVDPTQNEGTQQILIASIHAAMEQGIWRREGLLVADLAQEVGAREHRVRKAINQFLGHRNFASFINKARVEAAKIRLYQPEDANVTVLEIAYDVGFRSLGPFNRAFREVTGQSPTEFRAHNTIKSPAGFGKNSPILKKSN
jgi:AraC-like DNA-binding protein